MLLIVVTMIAPKTVKLYCLTKTVCQICSGHHAPNEPHNRDCVYYRYAFFAEHNRWPTWEDALEHCDARTKAKWVPELRRRGIKIFC